MAGSPERELDALVSYISISEGSELLALVMAVQSELRDVIIVKIPDDTTGRPSEEEYEVERIVGHSVDRTVHGY